jgi:hypothetical protein
LVAALLVVLVGEPQDEHSDYLERSLADRGLTVLRTSIRDIGGELFTWSPSRGVRIGGLRISSGAGIWRRPGTPVVEPYRPEYADFAYQEIESAFTGAMAAIPVRWLSPPSMIRWAELKPVQLRAAMQLGIRFPETIVTNDPSEAVGFAARHSAVVAKPVRYGLVATEPSPMVAWTRETTTEELATLTGPPLIIQRRLDARWHLRIVTVGHEYVAASLATELLDWRQAEVADWTPADNTMLHEAGPMALRVAERLGLGFSSQDWIMDGSLTPWFLEANPNGQWLFLDGSSVENITELLARKMVALGREQ